MGQVRNACLYEKQLKELVIGRSMSTQDSVRRFERVLNKVKGKKVAFEIGITYHAHCPMLYRAAATYQALGENQASPLISGMAETLSGHLLKGKRH